MVRAYEFPPDNLAATGVIMTGLSRATTTHTLIPVTAGGLTLPPNKNIGGCIFDMHFPSSLGKRHTWMNSRFMSEIRLMGDEK